MPAGNKLNKENNLADQDYWDNSYKEYQFFMPDANDTVRQWIEKHVPQAKGKSCFEIGCFPGRYLSVFGPMGYQLNGIDITPRVENDLGQWLQKCGFEVGKFARANLFEYNTPEKFDVVCSFGFIEHFKNWEEVIKIHTQLVKKDGLIVIETPNFRGFIQHAIHYFLDYESLKRHFLPSMNPDKWKRVLEPLGFEILYCNYFEKFEYWMDKPPTSFWRKVIFRVLTKMERRIKSWPPNKLAYSPYCGIIARKK